MKIGLSTAQIVDRANAVAPLINGDAKIVFNIVGMNELLFGVWPDDHERDGVGMMLIKGTQKMRTISAGEITAVVRWSAIPCTCLEQAEALRQVAGERDMRN